MKLSLLVHRMKCSDFGNSKTHPDHMNLDNLDQALHELGMLSAITEARREHLQESKARVMRIKPHFVDHWVRHRVRIRNTFRPYVLPMRHRTKSENSDVISGIEPGENREFKSSIYEPSTSSYSREALDAASTSAKRCQSLEDLNLAVDASEEAIKNKTGLQISPDMDCVSKRIQKLHVDE